MDLRCPRCAEPTDNEEFHELVAAGDFPNYTKAVQAFQSQGCVVVYGGSECDRVESGAYAEALYDLLGDDTDGAAAMMEDFDFLFN